MKLELVFDERDRDGVLLALQPFGEIISDDPWEYAKSLARRCFADLLAQNRPITDYLGGKPLDSNIGDGVLHPIYRGVGVVFVLTEPSSLGPGAATVSHVNDLPVNDEQSVMAKFWISATAPGRQSAAC